MILSSGCTPDHSPWRGGEDSKDTESPRRGRREGQKHMHRKTETYRENGGWRKSSSSQILSQEIHRITTAYSALITPHRMTQKDTQVEQSG